MIAGIDVALTHTGVALVNTSTLTVVQGYVITTQPRARQARIYSADQNAYRATELARGLYNIFEDHAVTGCIIEYPHGGAMSSKAARGLGIATGVVATVMYSLELPVEIVTPSDVKLAAGGKRGASKIAVRLGVERKMTIASGALSRVSEASSEHVWDAAAAVLAGRNGTLFTRDRI